MNRTAGALAAFLLSLPAGADEVAGIVETVYYEAAPGLLQQWHPRVGARRLWADIDVDGRKLLARVPEGMPISPGQRIAVRPGEPKSTPLARALPMTTVSRVAAPDPGASAGR